MLLHHPVSYQPCTCTEHVSLVKGKCPPAVCNDNCSWVAAGVNRSLQGITRQVCKSKDMNAFKMQVLTQS